MATRYTSREANGDVCIYSTEPEYSVTVTDEQFDRWRGGELIQRVMPHLTVEEREFLVSGTTPQEWVTMFPDTED